MRKKETFVIKSLFDVDSAINGTGYGLPLDLFFIDDEHVQDLFNKIEINPSSKLFVIKNLEYALKIRPKQEKNICFLLSKLTKKKRYIPRKDDLIQEDSIGEAIKNDDVSKFIKFINSVDFNPHKIIKINRRNGIYFVNDDISMNSWNKEDINIGYMHMIAYYGAVKCFKFVLLEGFQIDNRISQYAVAGGNTEIIHLLEQNNINFDNCFETSIKYNRFGVSDWLLRNYRCESVKISKTVEFFNTRAAFFLLKNTLFKDDKEAIINETFFTAAKIGNVSICKFLVGEFGANVHAMDICKKTPLHWAAGNGNLDVVQFLIECGANVDGEYDNETTPLHWASQLGHLSIVEFLVDKGADVERKDDFGATPLQIAEQENHIDIVNYLKN